MTKNSIAIAAALLASTTLTGAAQAGGLRVGLGFGFPLGHFVAHQMLNDSSRANSNPHCDKPRSVARSHDDDPPARRVKRSTPKTEVAEEPTPRPRKVVKVEKPDEDNPVEVKTAKLEDKSILTDAPVIYVPDTPPVTNFTGTQSTPATVRTAALTTDSASTTPTASTPASTTAATEQSKTDTAKTETKSKTSLQKICRRFSAAVAGLIDVPCE